MRINNLEIPALKCYMILIINHKYIYKSQRNYCILLPWLHNDTHSKSLEKIYFIHVYTYKNKDLVSKIAYLIKFVLAKCEIKSNLVA